MSGKTEIFDGVKRGEILYEYDDLLRLVSTKETRNEESYRDITYSYDDSGNRIKEESVEKGVKTTKDYTYEAGNILLGYTVTTGDEKTDEVKYEYDKNGNLIKESVLLENSRVCNDKVTLYTYNALNQLVSSETSEFTVTNEYNAEGLRTSKEVKSKGIDTSTKNYYTYEYDKVIFETDSENYIWNVQGINLISRQINGEMFYCMYNAHADITRMVDTNGELAEKYYYDEWCVETETLKYGDVNCDGEVDLSDYSSLKSFILQETEKLTKEQQIVSDVNGDGTVNMTDANLLKFSVLHPESVNFPADTNKDGFINEKNNIKYAGYFYDAETGLYYLNARFYDPETARFIQQDSYSGNILDPLSLNLYTYAQNNPISYYDPTGHSIKSLFKKAANTVKKVYNTVKATATVTKPVVKQAVKTAATVAVNTTFKKITTPIANTIKAAANKTENQRAAFQTVLAVGKSFQSPVVNAWANYAQGEYDTLAGQIDGFMQFSENPAQTIGNSVNYFLSDPLRNNPVALTQLHYQLNQKLRQMPVV